jgi:hypothetical protein
MRPDQALCLRARMRRTLPELTGELNAEPTIVNDQLGRYFHDPSR